MLWASESAGQRRNARIRICTQQLTLPSSLVHWEQRHRCVLINKRNLAMTTHLFHLLLPVSVQNVRICETDFRSGGSSWTRGIGKRFRIKLQFLALKHSPCSEIPGRSLKTVKICAPDFLSYCTLSFSPSQVQCCKALPNSAFYIYVSISSLCVG